MEEEKIIIKGASEHNLKNIDLEIPRNKLIVFTGVSGSGKSSLAFDTIYREGQRRFLESLSAYARQFIGQLEKPKVEHIEGLSPTISIDQKGVSKNPRSTVGTITEIYDYLRLLFARLGTPYCPKCGKKILSQTIDQITDSILAMGEGKRCIILAPIVKERKGEYRKELDELKKNGYSRVRIDNVFKELDENIELARYEYHTIEVVLDRIIISLKERGRIFEGVERASILGEGSVNVVIDEKDYIFSTKFACSNCQFSFSEIEPRIFSFNSPHGACPKCKGLGEIYQFKKEENYEEYINLGICNLCEGSRLKKESLSIKFHDKNIFEISQLSVLQAKNFFNSINLSKQELEIGKEIFKEINLRLKFLENVGLSYIQLNRNASSLAGGEAQRIKLARQLGTNLQGVLYILDEPSIGLHQRDNKQLLNALKNLKDTGNTVIVVEHDEETINKADYIVDIGPNAGVNGGKIVVCGNLKDLKEAKDSITGRFLRKEEEIEVPKIRRKPSGKFISIFGAKHFNLKNIDLHIPLNLFTVVTGVSGSGKSTLIHEILKKALSVHLHGSKEIPGAYSKIEGIEHIEKVIEIDQSPIGRTPRSNPATYTGFFDHIRELFANLPESKLRGYNKGRFSFNVKGGRCEECKGAGVKEIEMQFLSPVEVLCEVCEGSRFNKETLEIKYKGLNISQVLNLSIEEAYQFFKNIPKINKILGLLSYIGLGYMKLGQPSTTLSGGEAQRIKLASELHRPSLGKTLYILDEPTTGLHFYDIKKLISALQQLVSQGNSVIVIEHNLDVIKTADYIIDLGPEGGDKGGEIVFCGTPEELIDNGKSYLTPFLKRVLNKKRYEEETKVFEKREPYYEYYKENKNYLKIFGATKNNLKNIDVVIPKNSLTVITGVSGSGKTSLAFDTIFAEGQRRYIESLSTYARRFLGRLEKAQVKRIEGLAPAIAIDQRHASRNPRSTLATITEIYDYLRLLYAYIGVYHCPYCGTILKSYTPTSIVDILLNELHGERLYILAPIVKDKFKNLKEVIYYLLKNGYLRAIIDDEEVLLEEIGEDYFNKDFLKIEVVIDRIIVKQDERKRIVDSLQSAFLLGEGYLGIKTGKGERKYFSEFLECISCKFKIVEKFTPKHFSFNSHLGACPLCNGLGETKNVNLKLLIPHEERPILEKAVNPSISPLINNKDPYFSSIFKALSKYYNFDLNTPYKDLPDKIKEIILYGTGEKKYLVKVEKDGNPSSFTFQGKWKGLVKSVLDWYGNSKGGWWTEQLEEVLEGGICNECEGKRLKKEILSVRICGKNIYEVCKLTVGEGINFFSNLSLSQNEKIIAKQPLEEILSRLKFLKNVGLDYISLDRKAETLSGGEAERIRLATQLGSRLTGVIYVLDEPTIGLHQRDTQRLLSTLKELKNLGNSVIVVEHDKETMEEADFLIDLGIGAGSKGGEIIACGKLDDIKKNENSLTGAYLSGKKVIEIPSPRRKIGDKFITIHKATENNLKSVTVSIPLQNLVVVTGVSGSGKSTLIMDVLEKGLRKKIYKVDTNVGAHEDITGFEEIEDVISIDQLPIGKTPKSNPATYSKLFLPIRELFATIPEAKKRGYTKSRFSFNSREARCEACEGNGSIKVEMHFLSDVWLICENCEGKRYNKETLEIRYKGKNIADILDMEIEEAYYFFENHPQISSILEILKEVGLGYMKLGQPANTLSGGEAQRLKLASELSKKESGKTLYILDEPTTGLHFEDINKLVKILHKLVDRGNSVIIIEHNLDVIKTADYIIDLGPEGGDKGGEILFQGKLEEIVKCNKSYTGAYIKKYL